MRVMVVGNGGREHALVWKLSQDKEVENIICCPGNPGIAELAVCLPVSPEDTIGIVAACRQHSIDLVVFGPEEPLVNGAGDWLRDKGITVFGPSRAAARLEGSKVFAKLFMRRHKIATADFEVFDSYCEARNYVGGFDGRAVVKADGLARGKGVVVCNGHREADAALREIMVEHRFGSAGNKVIVEECLEGEEVSVMAICDGKNYILLPCSQDHKRAFDNDIGPNTGGMGACCPVPLVSADVLGTVESKIIRRVIEGMAEEGSPYAGVLYAGLMLTRSGPKVLEFNCRFGDPEAQAVFPSNEFGLGSVLLKAAQGRLAGTETLETTSHCVCVVACSGGYPGSYQVGKEIAGLDKLRHLQDVLVFHSGTSRRGRRVVTAGGRVVGVVGAMPTLTEAIAKAYEALGMIGFEGIHYRRDIGAKALRG
jgi:phosphoribosylamine--glycine ligase